MNKPQQMIWFNGQLVTRDQACVNVYDHGLLYGDGVFEGIRVYNGRVLKMATHLKRLFDSAKSIRLEIPYSIDQLAQAIRDTLQANRRTDSYIRLCVTRGVGTLGLNPNNCQTPTVFVIADDITLYPKEMYDHGMAVIVASTQRMSPAALSPRIKSMNYLNNILAKIEAIDAGVPEAIMLNHLGLVAECTGDNLFLVRRCPITGQSTLCTPPLHAGMLEGVTMTIVLGLARQAGILTAMLDITKHDLYTADELFLTGTAAEVIPVTKVDGRVIGSGQPGPVTNQLKSAFHALMAKGAPED